jgi:4-hydroxybenzoate polyprenyltransferase
MTPVSDPAAAAPAPADQLRAFARDIKLSHTVFALPFALAAAALVARERPVSAGQWLLILLAMAAARSSAMGFNRIVDRGIDQQNPRTTARELASGRLSLPWAWGLTLGSAGLFALAAGLLSPLALQLSPLVLLVLWGYSLTKRFTALCHLWLGFALALSPPCVWIALTGELAAAPLLMGGAILAWVAGFDVLYSLQDREVDQQLGLHSIPAALGEVGALRVSGALHGAAGMALLALPAAVDLRWPYFVAVAAILGLLGWEQSIVKPGDLSRMSAAFFNANAAVSVIFLAGVLLSL